MCFCPRIVADRPGRPTARVDRTKGRSTIAVDRRAQPYARLADTGPVDRPVDRTRELCSLYLGGRPGCSNGHIYDRWRSTGQSPPACQAKKFSLTASFVLGLYKPHSFGILAKISRAKFSLLSGFKNKFSKVSKEQKDPSYLF